MTCFFWFDFFADFFFSFTVYCLIINKKIFKSVPAGFESSIALVLALVGSLASRESGLKLRKELARNFTDFFFKKEKMREIPLQKSHKLQVFCFCFVVCLLGLYVFALLRKISNNTISTGFFL